MHAVALTHLLVNIPVWQDPFVEVIKFGVTHRAIGYFQRGDVEQVQDQILHKSVFRIRGSVAATNYLRVPRYALLCPSRPSACPRLDTHWSGRRDAPKGTQGLGLTGRYVCLQVQEISCPMPWRLPACCSLVFAKQFRQLPGLPCTMHLDYATNKKTVLRVTLSTMFTVMRSTGAVLRVPLT